VKGGSFAVYADATLPASRAAACPSCHGDFEAAPICTILARLYARYAMSDMQNVLIAEYVAAMASIFDAQHYAAERAPRL